MDKYTETYLKLIHQQVDFPQNIPSAEDLIDNLIAKNMKNSPSFKFSAQDWSEGFGKLNKDHATNCAIFMDGCLDDIYNNPSLFFKGGQDSNEWQIIKEYIMEVGYLTQRLKLEEITEKEVMRRAQRAGVADFVECIEEQNW